MGVRGAKKGAAIAGPDELSALRLLSTLDQDQRQRLAPLSKIVRVRARAAMNYLHHIGDSAAFVLQGRFKIVAATPSGAQLSLGVVERGEAFGLGFRILRARPRESLRIIAEETGALVLLPADALYDLAYENRLFGAEFIRHFAIQAAWAISRVYELASLDVRTRLQAELVRLADNSLADGSANGAECVIRPAPTHAALAAQIGTTREVVSRHLRDMEKDGDISFTRGVITLHKPDAMKRAVIAPTGFHLMHLPGTGET